MVDFFFTHRVVSTAVHAVEIINTKYPNGTVSAKTNIQLAEPVLLERGEYLCIPNIFCVSHNTCSTIFFKYKDAEKYCNSLKKKNNDSKRANECRISVSNTYKKQKELSDRLEKEYKEFIEYFNIKE